MKKLFSLVAVLCLAICASAATVWTETLDKNGTYIDKAAFNNNWPFVDQWWEAGNMVHEYTNVDSYGCSIRGKKLNSDAQNTIGFYFGAGKTADQCYFNLVNDNTPIYTAKEGDKLVFEVCSTEKSDVEAISAKIVAAINGNALTTPAGIETGAAYTTVTITIELPAGDINSLHISMDNLVHQKFITNLRIEGEMTEGIQNQTVSTKATKEVRDGRLVIVRDGVEYSVLGAQIK